MIIITKKSNQNLQNVYEYDFYNDSMNFMVLHKYKITNYNLRHLHLYCVIWNHDLYFIFAHYELTVRIALHTISNVKSN